MKRFLSFLLALCLIAGLTAGITLTAAAEETVLVSEIAVTVPEYNEGDVLSVDGIEVVSEGVVISEACWRVYNGEYYEEVEDNTYSEAKIYRLYLSFKQADGYSVYAGADEPCPVVTVNGVAVLCNYTGYTDQETGQNIQDGVWAEYDLIGSEAPVVMEAAIEGVPSPVPGGSFDAADITAPEGAHYTVEAAFEDPDGNRVTSGSFTTGDYFLYLTITPEEGYTFFLDESNITINGAPLFDYYEWVIWTSSYGDRAIELMLHADVEPEFGYLGYAEISGVPTAIEPGNTAAIPELTVDWPEDGEISITDVYWVDADGEPFTGKFEDGKIYALAVTLTVAEGYGIDYSIGLDVYDENGDYYDWIHAYPESNTTATAYIEYSLEPPVDSVEITVTEPAIGEAPSEPTTNSENVIIDSYYWYDLSTGEEVTEFKDGRKYQLEVQLLPAEGYQLAEDLEVTFNGEQAEHCYVGSDYAWAYGTYSFLDVITKVEIPALPEIEVGDTAEPVILEAPEGANYTIDAQWVQIHDYMYAEPFEGVFEDGNAYYLALTVYPNEGYEFAEDTLVIIDGKEVNNSVMIEEDYVGILKLYALGLEVIDTVELTTTLPENGKAPTEVTIPEDAPYTLDQAQWGYATKHNLEYTEVMLEDDTFAYGNYYWLLAQLTADEGYVFSDNLIVTVNGEVVELDTTYTGITAMNNIAIAFCDMGLLEEPAKETEPETKPELKPGDPDPSNPKTGSAAPLAALLALMAVSGMAITVISKKRSF